MSVHNDGTIHPEREVALYRGYARRLEEIEMGRGRKQPDAWTAIAAAAGIPRGSFENLRRGRLKGITSFLKARVRAALIRELEQEAARLEHQLSILRRSGVDAREDVVASAEAHLVAARRALNSAVRS